MTYDQVMKALKRSGTAQNRKIYARHGASGEMFGVSFGELGKLRKRIGADQEVAEALWSSGNVDAMTLATMVAEPETFGKEDLDRWVRVIDYSTIANQFAKYVVARSAPAPWAVTKWTKAKRPFVAIAGWDVVSCLAMEEDGGSLDLLESLGRIEAEIARPPDQVKHAMNNSMISIGLHSKGLRRKAIAAAKRIGRVEVDHGQTGCKTPCHPVYRTGLGSSENLSRSIFS